MKRFICTACLSVLLFLAACGTGHAMSVTLLQKGAAASKTAAASVGQPIVLTFGSNRVAIHDKSQYVPGKPLTSRDLPLSSLFVIRDHRALSQRTEYEAIYRHGPFQLAFVPEPGLLVGIKHVGMRPITGSTVVTQSGKVPRARANATVKQICDELDETRYGKYLALLADDVDLPTRYACSPEAATAHDAIAEAFQEIHLNKVITDERFAIPPGDCEWNCTQRFGFNVIGIKKGTTRPDDYYVVGAHYDSINDTTTPCKSAPGANDNASGVAGVLELAKVFSKFNTEASIVFVAFGGEEIDILGGRQYVNNLIEEGEGGNVKAFVVLDMISYYKNAQKIYIEGSNKSVAQKAAVDKMVQDTRTYTQLQCDYAYDFEAEDKGNSDHVPFLENGMPGALIIQWDSDASSYKYLHDADDKIKYQKLPFAMEILKVAAATLAQAGVYTQD